MITPLTPTNPILAIRANLSMLLSKQFRSRLRLLQPLNLAVIHVELLTSLAFVPREFVNGTGLEGAGFADHHWIFVSVDLAGAAVQSEAHDEVRSCHHFEVFVSTVSG